MSEHNPYEATDGVVFKDAQEKTRQPVSLWVLGIALVLTLLLSTKNAIEEGFPMTSSEAMCVILLAGLSQMPGLLVGFLRWKNTSKAVIPLLVAAQIVAFTGLLAYSKFAFDGRADSIDSAAHMHVIAFPIIHVSLAVCLYVLAAATSVVIVAIKRVKKKQQTASR